ncbi:MAG: hypothetical protein LBI17_01360 [Rickettsiales bacterium]|jgi:membrane associated rhomboid family serine protease|nr:hypothetical protein [Rickettsiales bacterium]
MNILNGGFLSGKKTYVTAAVGIVTVLASYLVGDIGLAGLAEIMFPLLGVIFLKREMTAALSDKIEDVKSNKK